MCNKFTLREKSLKTQNVCHCQPMIRVRVPIFEKHRFRASQKGELEPTIDDVTSLNQCTITTMYVLLVLTIVSSYDIVARLFYLYVSF